MLDTNMSYLTKRLRHDVERYRWDREQLGCANMIANRTAQADAMRRLNRSRNQLRTQIQRTHAALRRRGATRT